MDLKLNERKWEFKDNYDSLRKEISDKYREYIPDIDNEVYAYRQGSFDFGKIGEEIVKEMNNKRFNELSDIIFDIRNNTTPTSKYSNSISKTDNRYSNETKKIVKKLMSKGWTNNEIAVEIEKIYGSGSILIPRGLKKEPTLKNYFYGFTFKTLMIYGLFKITKILYRRKFNK